MKWAHSLVPNKSLRWATIHGGLGLAAGAHSSVMSLSDKLPRGLGGLSLSHSYWAEPREHLATWQQSRGHIQSLTATSSGSSGLAVRTTPGRPTLTGPAPAPATEERRVRLPGWLLCSFSVTSVTKDKPRNLSFLCKVSLVTWQGCYNENQTQRGTSRKPWQRLRAFS